MNTLFDHDNDDLDLDVTPDVVDFLNRHDAPRGALLVTCTNGQGERVQAIIRDNDTTMIVRGGS